jgi:hypothetical protein
MSNSTSSDEDLLLSEEDVKLRCKFSKEEEEVLRPEELLKQYHEKRTALDAKIIQQMLGIEIK